MEKLEELLNRLIEKGWKPRDRETLYTEVRHGTIHLILPQMGHLWKPIRLLVSKESGLWQFVCENGMIKGMLVDIDGSAYKYYITESSLKDESELEDFLLQNIKVEG